MKYQKLRTKLQTFYKEELPERAIALKERVYAEMDAYDAENPGLSAFRLKAKQYEIIANAFEPVLFEEAPFFYEMGALVALSDGTFNRGIVHANGWLYEKNVHLFVDDNPERYLVYKENERASLFSQSSLYIDILHFGIPMEKIFQGGLKGVCKALKSAQAKCRNEEEEDFIYAAIAGVEALYTIQKKFAAAAREKGLVLLAEMAERIPWEAPKTFLEGLNVMAFMRKALGSLEGVGFNTFGRPDVLLYPLYKKDMERGISEENLYDVVCRFMLVWDSALDRSVKMDGWSDYEYENTMTLGGCDAEGNPVWNGVTRLFLRAQNELSAIYPKIMYRYSADSPDAYLSAIGLSTLHSRSLGLYENDDCMIQALVNNGCTLQDARNYVVGGCWDPITPECSKKMSGEYLNLLRPMEWAIHQPLEMMEKNKMHFKPYDACETFEELYARYLQDAYRVMYRKAEMVAQGARVWPKVFPVSIVSALTEGCVENRKDISAGGAKYNLDCMYFTGFPDVVDSLMAIKTLCYDKKVCTLSELFEACRSNWQDERLRQRAMAAPSYGDGTPETNALAARLNRDLYALSRKLPTIYGGEYHIGHNQYTEIILYGRKMAATPNGRRTGEYISHGLTPSRLNKAQTASEVLSAVRQLGLENFSGNAVITLQLPAGKMDDERFKLFLRAAARAGTQALQINCVNREDLLKAQKEPEKYTHIIVRVVGFSAPFTSLEKHYQDEFLSRNFHSI